MSSKIKGLKFWLFFSFSCDLLVLSVTLVPRVMLRKFLHRIESYPQTESRHKSIDTFYPVYYKFLDVVEIKC